MHVEILSPDFQLYEGEAEHLQLPGQDGSFGLLDNHAPMIAGLKEGKVKLRNKDGEQEFEIKGGVVEVLKNKVMVMAE
jgi:F-type H+-transporting ATPase subunit epsilon